MIAFESLNYVLACPQCEAALGGSSRSFADYTLAGGAAVAVALTIGYALSCLLRPGESGPGHVKMTVLNDTFVDESEERP
jgi:hypothetical protein